MGMVVSLDREAAERVGPIEEREAEHRMRLREKVAQHVLNTFRVTNIVTLIAFGGLLILDEFNVWSGLIAPGDRIITDRVFIALLGATTVQVGAVVYLMAKHLFPSQSRNDQT
jgi:hypothetical protein